MGAGNMSGPFETVKRIAAVQSTMDKYKEQHFEWGKADCFSLVCNTLVELGHDNPMEHLRPYRSPLGALRTLRKDGKSSLADLIDSWGFERIAPLATLPGDVVGFVCGEGGWDYSLGIVIDQARTIAFKEGLPPVGGLSVGPVRAAVIAWRVPVEG